MPSSLCRRGLKVRFNSTEFKMDNPLYQFRMPNDQKMGDFGMEPVAWFELDEPLYYDKCAATSLCPTEEQRDPTCDTWINGIVNTEKINTQLADKQLSTINSEYHAATEMVYRLFTYPVDFVHFATNARDATKSSQVANDLNIEFIHNNLHYLVGGDGGHMSQVPVAAFDPVIQRLTGGDGNLDRLFAIWQTLNPDEWFDADTDGINPRMRTAPLRLFHKDTAGTLWTPSDARDWLQLGYTYPELQRWKYVGWPDQKAALMEYITLNYGVLRQQALRMVKSDVQIPGVVPTEKDGVAIKDYAVNIQFPGMLYFSTSITPDLLV
ncbi:hypothetical protein BJY01DRAFT_247870 [Aspergillus pseudoustus]|uniref:Tyrosinase copper-binding domain-containing protein n=1 Tax=Aspergillus pseudoustus TaxID=1810923 RepID=A0ABR4JYB3_9EURO